MSYGYGYSMNSQYCVPIKIGTYDIVIVEMAIISFEKKIGVAAFIGDGSRFTRDEVVVSDITMLMKKNSGEMRGYLVHELNNKARYCVMLDLMGRLCEGNTSHSNRIKSISEKP